MISAADALEDLANEVGTDLEFEDHGFYYGDTPHDSYQEYYDEVEEEIASPGKITLLVYNRKFKK